MYDTRVFSGLIKSHRQQAESMNREYDRRIRWYNSEFYKGQDDGLPSGTVVGDQTPVDDGGRSDVTFETNYPYAFVDTMVANVCPTAPACTVNNRREELRQAAEFREALINDTLKRNKAHKLLWQHASKTSVLDRSFLKVVWDDRRRMPIFRVVDPRFVWFDLTVERWEDITYLIEVTVLRKQDFQARVRRQGKKGHYNEEVASKASFQGYPTWLKDLTRQDEQVTAQIRNVFEWVIVYEVYDFTDDGAFYHFIDGTDEPLFTSKLPYKFVRNPFSLMTFNDNLTDIGGVGDVKLVAPTLMRLNELDTLELWFAQTAIPGLMVNTGLVDDVEGTITSLSQVEPGMIMRIPGKARAALSDIVQPTPTPTLSVSHREMRDRSIQTIEFTLGIPQYSRGQVGVSDVATEVALADAATRTRNGRRQKEIYDQIAWMAEMIIALYNELLDDNDVMYIRLTGEKKSMEIRRLEMALKPVAEANHEEQLIFDYEAVPYSSVENNRLIQLKNLRESWPIIQAGIDTQSIDPQKVLRKLADLLLMPDIVAENPAPQATPQVGQPPQAAQPPAEDTIDTGALPPGTEQPLPAQLPAGGPGEGKSPILSVAGQAAKGTPGVQTGPFRPQG